MTNYSLNVSIEFNKFFFLIKSGRSRYIYIKRVPYVFIFEIITDVYVRKRLIVAYSIKQKNDLQSVRDIQDDHRTVKNVPPLGEWLSLNRSYSQPCPNRPVFFS